MSLENKKKIAVLGDIRIFKILLLCTELSMRPKLMHIIDSNSVCGYIFTDYILLDDWIEAYPNPQHVLFTVKNRIIKFP